MHIIFARSFSHFKHSLSMIQQCLSFKSTSLWDICPFHLFVLWGPAGKHVWQWDGKKQRGKSHVSCIVSTFKPFTGKEKGAGKQRDAFGFAWKKAALVGEERRSRLQFPWYFIHRLNYGFHAALHNPLPACTGPGERHSNTKQRDQYVGRNLHPIYWSTNWSVTALMNV